MLILCPKTLWFSLTRCRKAQKQAQLETQLKREALCPFLGRYLENKTMNHTNTKIWSWYGLKRLNGDENESLRGEKLNYNSCASLLLRKSQNLLFLAPEVQWALKVYRVCSIHVFFKCFEPCPYLVCHVTTIENVGLSGSSSKYNNTFCQNTKLSTTCSIRLRKCTIFRKL